MLTVKVALCIKENLRAQKLFLTRNHPATALMLHVANNVLRQLRLSDLAVSPAERDSNEAGLPGVWPGSVFGYRHFGFTYRPPGGGVPPFVTEQLMKALGEEWNANGTTAGAS